MSSEAPSVSKTTDVVVEMSPSNQSKYGSDTWFGIGKISNHIWKELSLCAYPILLETASGVEPQMFDVTLDSCTHLCQAFDTTADGRVSRAELTMGLESKGFSSLDACQSYQELIDILEVINAGAQVVTPEQLSWILQRVKLEKLANSAFFDIKSYDNECNCFKNSPLTSFIYNPRESISADILTVSDQRNFFLKDEHHTNSFSSKASVHWIAFSDVVGLDGDLSRCSVAQKNRRIVLMLCLRFRLHPLSLDRVLNLDWETPKRYIFGRFDFLILPVYRLTKLSRQSMDICERRTKTTHSHLTRHESGPRPVPFVEIEQCQVAIWNDRIRWNELIHVQSKWISANLRIHSNEFDNGKSPSMWKDASAEPIFSGVTGQLEANYSMLRRGNSDWLQFAIFEAIAKDLANVVNALRSLIEFHQDLLHTEESHYATNNMKMIIALNDDLENLKRKIRPLRRIVRGLADDPERNGSIRRYLADCDEDINNSLLDMEQMSVQCDSLKNEVRTYKDTRTNTMLFILSMVTTLFIPAQFITGLYGMNFYDVDHQQSSIPELTWRYGYAYFWCLILLIIAGTLLLFKKMKMFPRLKR
uniref:EF-hand domain-containing protein n=1 Tax=Spongospora subterranea TaxID=70186 RepID=A0A0H5QYU4_9EUKA|eukprot:CRZ06836.1 hypothetical protein [Spongospora subterranea]